MFWPILVKCFLNFCVLPTNHKQSRKLVHVENEDALTNAVNAEKGVIF